MNTVSTKIEPALFNQFANLNFKPHQALAEYIDNAIQSYLNNKNNPNFKTSDYKFEVSIDFEWDEAKDRKTYAKKIVITDNAGGITANKFQSAFITAHRPEDNTGLNEYGMGMKTASCWFSRCWSLRTKAYGERIVRSATFDVDKIISESIEEIDVIEEEDKNHSRPYTIVTLEKLVEKNNITKAKLPKIKRSLESVYRQMLRTGEITIKLDHEPLYFNDYTVMNKPYFKDYLGEDIEWTTNVNSCFGKKQISGFIGLLASESSTNNGIVLIRRGRVVVGEEEGNHLYIKSLMGSKGMPQDKRVFGELEVKGFNVTFNKNGLAEDEDLEMLINTIAKEQLMVNGYNMLTQAKNFVKRDYLAALAKANKTTTSSEGRNISNVSNTEVKSGNTVKSEFNTSHKTTNPNQPVPTELKDGHILTSKTFNYDGHQYFMELRIDQNISDMLNIGNPNENLKIITRFNNKRCPLENPDRVPKEVAKMLCSLAISTFIAKQRGGKIQELLDFFNKYIEQYD